jgi:hypothetical protein
MPRSDRPERHGKRAVWASLAVGALAPLVLTACSNNSNSSSGGQPQPDATIFVQKFRYHGMPTTLSAGIHEFEFQNRESFTITHEMIPIALPPGKTSQDVINGAKANGPDDEDTWLHIGGDFGAADTGASVVEWLYLPAGNYAIACWQTGVPNNPDKKGPPHAAKGMVFQFKVT